MDTREALITNLKTSAMVCGMYLEDLTDEEAMQRPHPKCNHINWQLGHLIASEFGMASACGEGIPKQHEAILGVIAGMSDDDFDKPGPESMQAYAPTMGALVNMMGSHWMMHAGQWVVLRRQLGRDIVI